MGIFDAHPKDQEEYGHVGEVEQVNIDLIQQAISESRVPVVSCLGQDTNGNRLKYQWRRSGTSSRREDVATSVHYAYKCPGCVGAEIMKL